MADAERARAELQGSARAYDAILALGTNLGDRIENIEEAIRWLTADGSIRLVSRSKLYRSAPWGVTDQDWFINACIAIQTTLSPHELLKRCQTVENDMGRVRTLRWGPRIIDVDILTFQDLTIAEPDLTVPHPLIAERAFVLVPLKDVAPELRLNGRSIDAMLETLDRSEVEAVQP
ncbi:2-amino-4-hydroxy-6-hydroxymethyldihydropteridine diphosphokinase [Hyphomicrobium facile]|uniref:2-amino-4-hydroxy-6-hydroxymethyldihydropteridine pyrophosphokinase n=1 Tax=Hyphomicrobium facile TaxID=51670 RepID=A0A1I7NW10_9HYPH|nr:2-amino-4-hydroxy-6-hydroxymethyldihydropteridine diphosphokinase [Hyphomicrobium facile]SFV38832.1 2-amino-4-hydroxy-6-hydroxymethyldihydropteridinediphosphokinase [Hyphomicrobium facile]